jgi:hypothetical protein
LFSSEPVDSRSASVSRARATTSSGEWYLPGAELLLDQALTVGIEMNGHRTPVYPQELGCW